MNEFNPLIGGATGTATARVKVLNPLTSLGPGMRADLIGASEGGLRIRVPRPILVGSVLQIRTAGRIAFGEVRASVPVGADYEIEVVVKQL